MTRRLPQPSLFVSKSGAAAMRRVFELQEIFAHAGIHVFCEHEWRRPFPNLPWTEMTLPSDLDPDALEFLAWVERLFENTDLLWGYQEAWDQIVKPRAAEQPNAEAGYRPFSPLGQKYFYNSLLSPWNSYVQWCYHLFLFSNSDVVIGLVTGEERDRDGRKGLSSGMDFEMFTAAAHGIPVVWIGTTRTGCRMARSSWEFTRDRSATISHFFDWTESTPETNDELRRLCVSLTRAPRPNLPQVFKANVPVHFRHQIAMATREGWQPRDLSFLNGTAKAEVHYGSHMCGYRWLPQLKYPARVEELPFAIADVTHGVVEGDLVVTQSGLGRIKIICGGGLVLDWDYVCDIDPHLTTVGFACGLPVTGLPAFLLQDWGREADQGG